jgi:tRNA G10  N-methylase Trm11
MKNSLIIMTTITLISVLVISGCDNASNKMERAEVSVIESERDLEIAKSEVEAEVQIYRQEVSNDIMANNRAIAEIKERIQNEDEAARADHNSRIAELELENREMKRKMDNYRVVDKENWSEFKEQFSSAMDDLEYSLDNFFSTATTSRN